ncbi:MAG: twin-arginine translocase TatA/TatE family subunit [Bryobacteraceae bacterium]|nr:twin-arginine translocase TatA/TatE family subunit [Bryobacteraceae bacterium]
MFEDLLKPQHLLLILAVALLVFGPSKLPELGKGLAQGIKNFKDAIKGEPEVNAADKTKSTEKPS